MDHNASIARRDFLRTAGAGIAAAPAILAQRKPNDVIGIAVIGVGTRGHYLMQEFQKISGVEVRIICDLYEGNIRRAQQIATSPKLRVVKEWEKAIADPGIDAVVIATPDFWHAPMTIRAAQAGKDVYVEKGWCITLQQAKDMRRAVKDNKIVMQLGHNYNSMAIFHKAREIYRSGQLGKVTVARMYIDRTGPYPEWQFYTNYNINELPKDATSETIDWERFLGKLPNRPFDAERFFRWRCWWDYGTGIAGDLMSHLWDSVNMVAGMGIPETISTQGGLYFWKNDREVPDVWHVLFDYPKRDLCMTFSCTFHNRHVGEMAQFLGRDGTLEVSPRFCRTFGAEWKPENEARLRNFQRVHGPDVPMPPDYEFQKDELTVSSHWQDFIDCIRTRERTRCHEDRAFEEAATIMMSVEAFRRDRKVRWDAAKEEII